MESIYKSKCPGCGNVDNLSHEETTKLVHCQRCYRHYKYNENTKTDENTTLEVLKEMKTLIKESKVMVTELRDEYFDTLTYLSTLNDVESIHKAITDIVEDK